MFWPHFSIKKSPKNATKNPVAIVALLRQTFWFKLVFLLPENEISIEHFRELSGWIQATMQQNTVITGQEEKKL